MTEASTSETSSPWNACRPLSISYRTQPKLKMSDRASTASPLTCSGDIYPTVPSTMPGWDSAMVAVSCVTGEANYDVANYREILSNWTDHPQRLWDVIDETLAAGVESVIHVGPAPSLIAATFARLENNVGRFVADSEAIYSYEDTRKINTLIVGRAITGLSAFV